MNLVSKSNKTKVRGSPTGDAQWDPLPLKNGLGVPQEPRLGLKKLVAEKIRIGSWNVGSLSGRSREIVEVLRRRKVNILCVQETKWKGSSANELGEGFKLFYTGTKKRRNGFGIILEKELKEKVVSVLRVSDRIIIVKVVVAKELVNVVSCYAPQVGCPEVEKEAFWMELEEYMRKLEGETVIMGGDLNGHIGGKSEGYEGVHGGRGFGRKNEGGGRILEMAEALEMVIMNTCFKKKEEHLITFKSGGVATQIDYVLVQKKDVTKVRNCKVIPGEAVVGQHRLLVMDTFWEDSGFKAKKKAPKEIEALEAKGEEHRRVQDRGNRRTGKTRRGRSGDTRGALGKS